MQYSKINAVFEISNADWEAKLDIFWTYSLDKVFYI